MKTLVVLPVAALLVAAGCGAGDGAPASSPQTTGAAPYGRAAEPAAPARETAAGTKISARGSRFGTMLWGPRRQAIYVFQRDVRGGSRCYGDCAKAWPPVYTTGGPVAGRGVRRSLLGTTRRKDGRRQVTYAGRPLYYYAHEGPGEVLCHNVELNGGLWWVVGPDGKRRP